MRAWRVVTVARVQQLGESRAEVGVDAAVRLVFVTCLVSGLALAQPFSPQPVRCAPRGKPVAAKPKTPRLSSGPSFAVGARLVAFQSPNGRLLVRQLDDGKVRFNAQAPGEVLYVDDTRVLLLRTSQKSASLVELTFPSGEERTTTLPVPPWVFRAPAGRWMYEEHTVDVWPAERGWVMSWRSTVPPGPSGVARPPEVLAAQTQSDCGSLLITPEGVKEGGFITVPDAAWTGDRLQLEEGAVLRSAGEKDLLEEADGGVVVLGDRSKEQLNQGTMSVRVGSVVAAWVRGPVIVAQVQYDDGQPGLRVVGRTSGAVRWGSALPTPPRPEPMPPLP